MKRLIILLAVALLASAIVFPSLRGDDCQLTDVELSGSEVRVSLTVPAGTTRVLLDTSTTLDSDDWREIAIQRVPDGDTATEFSVGAGNAAVLFARCRATNDTSYAARRVRLLYNGYILTVDPRRALSSALVEDRHRLYVIHAVLIDPDSGKVAAVYPFLDRPGIVPMPRAVPCTDVPELTAEVPSPPGSKLATILEAWRDDGVDERLLTNLDVIDLQGAVVTPGLIDSHFHVTSWSKKLPEEGRRFGYFVDVSDPRYTIDEATLGQRSIREGLSGIIEDANACLDEEPGREGILLHGYVRTAVDEDPADSAAPDTCLFACSPEGCEATAWNPRFLLNDIGRGVNPVAALLVHTSGQVCWYNGELLTQFNARMEEGVSLFGRHDVTAIAPPADGGSIWTFQLAHSPHSGTSLFEHAPPLRVDVVVEPSAPGSETLTIPVDVVSADLSTDTIRGRLVLDKLADELEGGVAAAWVVPFYRTIPLCIPDADWLAAAEFWNPDAPASGGDVGQWDPRRPHGTNWYNGAERGLVQFVHDGDGGVWRPSGYAEHYVMRDALGAVVQEPPSVEEGIRFRRNLARWCHRHGITGVNDIMFYRRSRTREEFHAYEALSYARNPADGDEFFTRRELPSATRTGELFLRVGLYYYVENVDEVDDVLALAYAGGDDFDVARLRPSTGHPEYPGWVRWQGWKLQLDGGTGARTLFSSAPMSKSGTSNAFTTTDENGAQVQFRDHGYGLLTMTSEQEQVFDSRESAALYWLVRECDPELTTFYNDQLAHDWTFLREGVGTWPELDVNVGDLAQDLRALDAVDMTVTVDGVEAAVRLAHKVAGVFVQVKSARRRTLAALARIRYARDLASGSPYPVPGQVACHCLGDGGVDLYTRMLWTFREDLEVLSQDYPELPVYWQDAVKKGANLSVVERGFDGERYRIEHLLCVSPYAINLIRNPEFGIDRDSVPAARNVTFSTQPALLAVDGNSIRGNGFPEEQELWPLPTGGVGDFWRGLPALPRSEHHMPCPLFQDYDIPYALNSDPPSVRDPRPAITMVGAVARCPIEPDPGHWLDQDGDESDVYPREYLVGKVFAPLGHMAGTDENPMQVTVEQALCGMTFWAAYSGGSDVATGALASPRSLPDGPGWFADLVVWRCNPLAIEGPDGTRLADLAHPDASLSQSARVAAANAFLDGFRPALTVVGGIPVYRTPHPKRALQGTIVVPDP